MNFTLAAFIAALLSTSKQDINKIDDESQVVKVTSHTQHSLEEIIDMIDVAAKRNLRGKVSIDDLTNCSPDDKNNEIKNNKMSHMREKTTILEYTYESKNERK